VRSGGPGRSRLGGSPTVLRRELADRGLDCSIRLLSRYLRTMQATGTLPTPGPEPPTTRTLVKWLMSPLDRLDEDQQRQLKAARQACPHLDALCGHIPRLRPDPDKPARRCKAPRLRTHVRHMNRRSKPLHHRSGGAFACPVPGPVSLLVSVGVFLGLFLVIRLGLWVALLRLHQADQEAVCRASCSRFGSTPAPLRMSMSMLQSRSGSAMKSQARIVSA
jgi:hypothetical protein